MPSIYVAVLADYNAGNLTGEWVDLDGLDADDLREEIARILRTSKHPNVTVPCPTCGDEEEHPADCADCHGRGEVPSAEEWAIHDYEDMPSLGEYPSVATIIEAVERITPPAGVDDDEWAAYLEHCDDVGKEPSEEDLDDCRAGSGMSELDWCEEFLESCGTLDSIPANLRAYFDTRAYLRDMKLGGDVDFVEHNGTTYAFWRH